MRQVIITFFLIIISVLSVKAQISAKAGFDEVIFVVRGSSDDGHWYANFGYYASGEDKKAYKDDSKLCKYNLKTKKLTVLFEDAKGTYRDPQMHYDGNKILFSYRKGGKDDFHLYETDINGSYLRQITNGPYTDIEPTYLPDGDIMFVSTRCNRWVNCWATQVAVLYRCKSDGSGITQLSANIEHDNTPWVLPNGQIMYTRWEYIDRSQVHFHHLWVMNPDGTRQMVLFGNQTPSVPSACLLIDAKPIPGTDDVILSFSPGHGKRDHGGYLARLSLKIGPDDKNAIKFIHQTKRGDFIYDPYPVKDSLYLVSDLKNIKFISETNDREVIFTIPPQWSEKGMAIHEPRPIIKRNRENIIASTVNKNKNDGILLLQNVYEGRNMSTVDKGSIKKLLILEALPKPVNYTGGNEPLSYTGTFTLERIIGTVPVEEHGSAHFKLPANRSFFFVALDKDDRTVQRMKSFTSLVPGEVTTCIGCHENRTQTPRNQMLPIASNRAPSIPEKDKYLPEVIDFPRDIQPILDKHCVKCHSPQKRSGGILLTSHRGPVYSHAYFNLMGRNMVNDGRNQYNPLNKPGDVGDVRSPLVLKIEKGHGDVKLKDSEMKMIRYWINTGAVYPGTYGALGSGMVGRMSRNQTDRKPVKNELWEKASDVIKNNCNKCHKEIMPDICSEQNLTWWNSRNQLMNGAYKEKEYLQKISFSRHILYDLSEPGQSTILKAPLEKSDGGYGLCKDIKGNSIFKSTKDNDYETLLKAISNSKNYLDSIKRFDMEGFTVRPEYFREMKRYGVISEDVDIKDIDPYKTDRKYWDMTGKEPGNYTNCK